MGWLDVGLNLLGVGTQAYGEFKQGQDAKDVYEFNQAIAEYQARYIEEAADIEIASLERDVGDYVSRQRAIQGKSGTVANIGSNLDAIKRSYVEADIDAGLIRWNAGKRAELARQGANLLGTQADQFATAGFISAGTTLLGGLSKWDWKTSQLSTSYKSGTPNLTGKAVDQWQYT